MLNLYKKPANKHGSEAYIALTLYLFTLGHNTCNYTYDSDCDYDTYVASVNIACSRLSIGGSERKQRKVKEQTGQGERARARVPRSPTVRRMNPLTEGLEQASVNKPLRFYCIPGRHNHCTVFQHLSYLFLEELYLQRRGLGKMYSVKW